VILCAFPSCPESISIYPAIASGLACPDPDEFRPPPKRSPDNLRFMSSTPIVAVPLPETDIPLRLQIYLVNNYRTIIHIKYFKKTLSLLFSMFNEIFSLTFNK
jgi:hypothetical protein